MSFCLRQARDFEIERLPVGVRYQAAVQETVSKQRGGSREGVRFVTPIRRIQFDPVPLDRLLAQKLGQGHIEPLDR